MKESIRVKDGQMKSTQLKVETAGVGKLKNRVIDTPGIAVNDKGYIT